MPREPKDIPPDHWKLALTRGIGPNEGRLLLEAFAGASGVLAASVKELSEVLGRDAEEVRRSMDSIDVQREFEEMERESVCGILPGDLDWPELLRTATPEPLALWVRGTFQEADRFSVAVVGSRICSAYGMEQADRFAGWLAEQGFTIVSGGARGIDAAAHRAALRRQGRTVVVLAGGVGRAYPPEHASLFDAVVAAGGALCSEFPTYHPSEAGLFPRRNRIISALSLGTLLIEARVNSGALITGRLAAESHGREVMAVPGRVDSPSSEGCHRAIREGWAALVTSVADVSQQLRSSSMLVAGVLSERAAAMGDGLFASRPAAGVLKLTPAMEKVLEAAKSMRSLDYDQLSQSTNLGVAEVMAAVTRLELGGIRLRN
ncbi:MAG: DNA-processing protein DprA [Planctomycetes bacterium]|nr:DNA-processing protein DprA [Planctomycetota bacterium]